MRTTADAHLYAYTSWQTAYPGHAVDLTGLDFPPVRYDDGVDAALRLLDLGPSPSTEIVAELRDDLRDVLYAVEDLECAYSAVLYPEPDRNSEHVWVGFSVFDNRDEQLTPAEALAEEVLDPAKHDLLSERVKDLDLIDGPAARVLQTAVSHHHHHHLGAGSFQLVPRLTVCGTARAAGARYVIRGNATSAHLVGVLEKVVMAWARGVSFEPSLVPGSPLITGAAVVAGAPAAHGVPGIPGGAGTSVAPAAPGALGSLVTPGVPAATGPAAAGTGTGTGTGTELAFHPRSTPLPPLG